MKIILILITSVSLTGCNLWQGLTVREDVKPWERGILAKQSMQIPHDKLNKEFDEHIYFSKEASTGGFGLGGGGCGCN